MILISVNVNISLPYNIDMASRSKRLKQLASMYQNKKRSGWSDSDIKKYLSRKETARLKDDITWADIKSSSRRSQKRREDFNEYTQANPDQRIHNNQPGMLRATDPNQPKIRKKISSREFNEIQARNEIRRPSPIPLKSMEIQTPRGSTRLNVSNELGDRIQNISPEDFPEDYMATKKSGYPGLVPVNDFSEITQAKIKEEDWGETAGYAIDTIASPVRGIAKGYKEAASMYVDVGFSFWEKVAGREFSNYKIPSMDYFKDPDIQNAAIVSSFAAGWQYGAVRAVGYGLTGVAVGSAAVKPTPRSVGTAIGIVAVPVGLKVTGLAVRGVKAGARSIRSSRQTKAQIKLERSAMDPKRSYINYESIDGSPQRTLQGTSIPQAKINFLRSEIGQTTPAFKSNVPTVLKGTRWENIYAG